MQEHHCKASPRSSGRPLCPTFRCLVPSIGLTEVCSLLGETSASVFLGGCGLEGACSQEDLEELRAGVAYLGLVGPWLKAMADVLP